MLLDDARAQIRKAAKHPVSDKAIDAAIYEAGCNEVKGQTVKVMHGKQEVKQPVQYPRWTLGTPFGGNHHLPDATIEAVLSAAVKAVGKDKPEARELARSKQHDSKESA